MYLFVIEPYVKATLLTILNLLKKTVEEFSKCQQDKQSKFTYLN
jgi:hypothetical protein